MIDYRTLLIKYISHVGYAEGISFLGDGWYDSSMFTKEEWEELQKLDKMEDVNND